ncbi:MAG: CcmD family protein [Acidobacteria bacterium]|nr:CcmD family protein [Acidobacteriota bacterium]
MNWYLFAGYSVIMGLILGYIGFLDGKIRKLRHEMEILQNELDGTTPAPESTS